MYLLYILPIASRPSSRIREAPFGIIAETEKIAALRTAVTTLDPILIDRRGVNVDNEGDDQLIRLQIDQIRKPGDLILQAEEQDFFDQRS